MSDIIITEQNHFNAHLAKANLHIILNDCTFETSKELTSPLKDGALANWMNVSETGKTVRLLIHKPTTR